MLKFLKPFSFLPALLLMYMIYSFSAQDGATSAHLSYSVSYKAIEVCGELLGADFEDWEIDRLANRFQTPVRKLAHMTEYFALAVAVAFPLYVYGMRGILLLFFAGLICVGFACGDEYHQSKVAGRGPSKRDVLIDSFGVFWGIILVRIIGWTGRSTIFRPFSKKRRQDADTRAEYPEEAGRSRQAAPEYYGYADQRYSQQSGSAFRGQSGQRYSQSGPAYHGQTDQRHTRQADPAYHSQADQRHTRQANPAYHEQADQRYAQQSGPAYYDYDQPDQRHTRQANPAYHDQRYPQQSGPAYYDQDGREYSRRPSPYSYGPASQGRPQAGGDRRCESSGRYDDPENGYRTASARDFTPQDVYDPEYDPEYDSEYYDEDDTTSDRLSEDMSFRKLVSDLKDQKQARRSARRADSSQAKP